MIGCATTAMAQGGLTDMSHSQQAMMTNTPLGAVKWTGGFWGDRFNMLSTTGIWSMWDTWNTPWEIIDDMGLHGSNGFRNFEVAAGTVKGKHHGPPFHDGDMYKWLEACATVYAITKDPKLDALMDQFIEQVALAQRADGYIHTPVVISERNAGIDSHAMTENAAGIEIGKDQKHAFASRHLYKWVAGGFPDCPPSFHLIFFIEQIPSLSQIQDVAPASARLSRSLPPTVY